ncbi:MAG: ABC transporter ATP-binding protein [Gemmatimonadetes bacterium]|jgi:ABC-2 type transport system ATP-binding protein|nr:ABC transporter ATP-binding protein [Gemmatimonadota bacterium]
MTVELAHVSKWYGNIVAVNDVSFTLTPGVTGLLGPNGAGKSTILHMLVGLLRPSSGTVTVNGVPSWQHPEIYRTLGFVPESESVYSFLTGYELVRLNARLQQLPDADAAVKRAIDLVEMTAAQGRPVATYSKGMRQRIKIAAMLVHSPTVLLLDEPFNGMDPKQRLQMMAVLRRLADAGSTILVSSHILEEVDRLADTVLVIIGGRLAASGTSRVIRQLMTDRPHTFTVRTSDDRLLASSLIRQDVTASVEVTPAGLSIRTSDLGAFTRALPRLARESNVSILEVHPADESLESVFSYLVQG